LGGQFIRGWGVFQNPWVFLSLPRVHLKPQSIESPQKLSKKLPQKSSRKSSKKDPPESLQNPAIFSRKTLLRIKILTGKFIALNQQLKKYVL
jgi:hypothetical protein